MEISDDALRVGELFAGVGGFRVGLEGLGTAEHPGAGKFKVVYSNQWEPAERQQVASRVYIHRFGDAGHSNEDINIVIVDKEKLGQLIDAKLDMLVAGFPCQDYSVARPANQATGIEGKKGVLWWSIYDLLKAHLERGRPVKHVLLENVDRLLSSPSKCRGRDFAIILASLGSLGYAVEWRVVNAAEHGWPQQRKRVFILAHYFGTSVAKAICETDAKEWLTTRGTFVRAFPIATPSEVSIQKFAVGTDPIAAQAQFEASANGQRRSLFERSGIYLDGTAFTAKVTSVVGICPEAQGCGAHTLGDVVARTTSVAPSFYIDEADLFRWREAKAAQTKQRVTAEGFGWTYKAGAMSFPDKLDRSSRTIITSEGGSTPLRTKHAVREASGRLRRLTPEELEELSGFPRGWTNVSGVSDVKRAKLIGNALVTGVVRQIGRALFATSDSNACS